MYDDPAPLHEDKETMDSWVKDELTWKDVYSKIPALPKEVDKVDGGIKGGDYSLPTKNTPIKGSKKKAESYTVNYLAGIKS